MTSLYELNKQLSELLALEELDKQTLADTWEALALERSEKIENVLCFIKHLKAMADMCKVEAKSLSDRSKSYDSKAESLLGYLQSQLEPREKYESARHCITWRNSQAVEIEVETSELPQIYQRLKVEPNKQALKDDLKAGATVEGVKLVDRLTMGVK